MDWEEQADIIGSSIQEAGPHARKDVVLTGWVVIAEWMDSDGERWLSKMFPPHMANWQASGMHHEALYGDWPDGTDD